MHVCKMGLFYIPDTSKAELISNLNFKTDADALPFLKLPVKTLIHIVKTTQNDVKCGYCENRLYYLSSHIKVGTFHFVSHLLI